MIKYNLQNYYDWPLVLRSGLIGFVCIIILFLAYYLDFSNLQTRFRVIQQQESDLKTQLQAIFKTQAELNAELASQADLIKTLTLLQGKLVKKSQLPEALNEILKIGAANGLQFNSFTPDKEEIDTIYTKTPIKIVAIGSYDQIANFMDQIAHMTPIITINDFVIQYPQKATTNATATAATTTDTRPTLGPLATELLLEAYYLNSEVSHESKK